jgi:exopolysaccharide production protein ExoQ
MPPYLALLLWLILLLALFSLDPSRGEGVSWAVWIPTAWMFFLASRLPSQWMGGQLGQAAQALEEGNPLDRTISSALILAAIVVLLVRNFKWASFLSANPALILLLVFALISFVWSDYPLIALKRWFRDIGNYLVVLVVLSERKPLEAMCALLRRLGYLLIPLSIVFIKYFPDLAKQYDTWTGAATFTGVTTSKNMLGLLCLVNGLFFFWDIVTRWADRRRRRVKRLLLIDTAFIGMTFWLLMMSNSATSRVCLTLGCLIVWLTQTKWFIRRPAILKWGLPAFFLVYITLAFGFNINGHLAESMGRDPTLTDRTKIWAFLLSMHTNPVLGCGYESFWLGPRLQWFWTHAGLGQINEAHNGYLQVYLNLGLVGDALLIALLAAAYFSLFRKRHSAPTVTSLGLGVWTVLLFYNMSEAAFLTGLLWVLLLLCALMNRQHASKPASHEEGTRATSERRAWACA